jgi:hypothetical protein
MTPISLLFRSRFTGPATAVSPLFVAAGGVPTFQELRPQLERELRRARRYERPLGLVVFALEPVYGVRDGRGGGNGTDAAGAGGAAGTRYVAQLEFLHLALLLRDTLRESDIISYAPETREFLALLPEADQKATEQAAERVHRIIQPRLTSGVRANHASYPRDGLTLDDLVNVVRGSSRERRSWAVLSRAVLRGASNA